MPQEMQKYHYSPSPPAIFLHTEIFIMLIVVRLSFPGNSVIKNPPANAGDVSSIPGSGRSPGEGNGTSLLAWKIP